MTDFFQDFSRPWFALCALVPFLYLLKNVFLPRRKPALVFSDIKRINIAPTLRVRLSFLPGLFYICAWIILCIALMGPRKGHEETKITTEGIAISMVMDVSASMAAEDMSLDNSNVISRYDMVENVFKRFIRGDKDMELNGRPNDMVSLVVFGKYVDDLSPLTLDHDVIIDHMQNTLISVKSDIQKTEEAQKTMNRNQLNKMYQSKNPIWNGTAVYEGVALGADMLKNTESEVKIAGKKGQSNYSIKSKVLIVLTDGEDNASTITEDEAINVAKEFGVKIYSIAIHGQPTQQDIFGVLLRSGRKQYDDGPLKEMAQQTGGKFYQATSPDSLSKIYKDIDLLEKTKISKQVTMEYSPTHRPWLLVGLILIGIALLLQNTYFRVLA
ncbi:MAG: VWA domain-containing protein [Planctomycetes bacterium]|nr:VWA domain-containing protein [Planctomycetota bacterium]